MIKDDSIPHFFNFFPHSCIQTGHHTQFQGIVENFQYSCGGPEQFLHDFSYYTAFGEGKSESFSFVTVNLIKYYHESSQNCNSM